MKAKMQSDPPTIFSVGGFSDMKDYGDVIEDVSDLDIMQHALEGTTDTFTKDGKVYAVPLYMEGYGFVINKQMFEDAGVSVDSMMNFEGMKAGFDTLKEKIDNGEMKDKYPNLEAVMEYPTKELWIAGDHDVNVALTHDLRLRMKHMQQIRFREPALKTIRKWLIFRPVIQLMPTIQQILIL